MIWPWKGNLSSVSAVELKGEKKWAENFSSSASRRQFWAVRNALGMKRSGVFWSIVLCNPHVPRQSIWSSRTNGRLKWSENWKCVILRQNASKRPSVFARVPFREVWTYFCRDNWRSLLRWAHLGGHWRSGLSRCAEGSLHVLWSRSEAHADHSHLWSPRQHPVSSRVLPSNFCAKVWTTVLELAEKGTFAVAQVKASSSTAQTFSFHMALSPPYMSYHRTQGDKRLRLLFTAPFSKKGEIQMGIEINHLFYFEARFFWFASSNALRRIFNRWYCAFSISESAMGKYLTVLFHISCQSNKTS